MRSTFHNSRHKLGHDDQETNDNVEECDEGCLKIIVNQGDEVVFEDVEETKQGYFIQDDLS